MSIDAKLPTRLSRLTHDLLNPLAAVHGNLTFLEGMLEGDLRDATRDALEEVRRLERLLRELQQFGHLTTGGTQRVQPVRTSLAAWVRRAVEGATGEARLRSVAVEVLGDAQANADATLFVSAIRNLLAIALRYSKQGGVVKIAISAESTGARVVVVDHGSVIPEVERAALLSGEDVGDVARARPAAPFLFALAKAEVEAQGGTVNIRSDGQTEWEVRIP